MPLLKAARERHPDIKLFINDNFGPVLSEVVKTSRMDTAIIYAPTQLAGVRLLPLLVADLFLIAPILSRTLDPRCKGLAMTHPLPTAPHRAPHTMMKRRTALVAWRFGSPHPVPMHNRPHGRWKGRSGSSCPSRRVAPPMSSPG